jgi:predicted NUDIX family NTP pyrophosphohydrolase
MPKQSAGILVYRFRDKAPQIFLCHPGGPFYKNKDLGVWSIPKGEFEKDEEPFDAAKREFTEETGQKIDGNFSPLTPVKYKNGKIVHAWAVENNTIDEEKISSNTFPLEWPPKSGKFIDVPEVDGAGWFSIDQAKEKIIASLLPLILEIEQKLLQ